MKKNFLFHLLFLVLLFCSLSAESVTQQRYLLRFPDVFKDVAVFVSGGDIWRAPVSGGTAVKLTFNDGNEIYPKISPDGRLIAFTAAYDGNNDVYTMNMQGGEITRVTYHPGTDTVVGWNPVRNKIIFSSSRESYGRFSNLFLINPDGTGLEKMMMHEAAWGSFSPDGSKIAYNKVAREHRTWKRYKGGLAQDIFIFNLKTMKDMRVTKFRGTDRAPMWIGNKIYFSSDRDGTLNLYSYDTQTSNIEQKTFHKKYDVRRPSNDGSKIIYENGGLLYIFDTKNGSNSRMEVGVLADAPETRPYYKNVKKNITDFDCSPTGKRALIVARGEIFTVPVKNGPVRNLTLDSGSRDKDGVWSPDGSQIAFISDKSGEYEIYIIDSGGETKAVKLTSHKDGYRQNLRWSPDGKKIAFADQTLTFYYIDVKTGKITKVDKALFENVDIDLKDKPIYDYSWSPDNRYIAYSKMDSDLITKVYIYSLETKKTNCISNGLFNDFNPVFTKDGKHLLFISLRQFSPVYGDFDWEMVYKKSAGIYAVTLEKNGDPLLPLLSDEESKKMKISGKKKSKPSKPALWKDLTKIDFNGISERIERLPLKAGNYRNISVNKGNVFYLNSETGDYNRFKFRELGPRDLYSFSFKKRKQIKITGGISDYRLSFDGKTIAFRKGDSIGLINAGPGAKPKIVNLSGLRIKLNPRKEWLQIYNEAWRMERDFYYEPGMKGNDWKKIGEKYRALLKYATNRSDVTFLIGEMIGELNTSHTYVFGGDSKRRAHRIGTGMLGVDWGADSASGKYYFKKIYNVPDWSRSVIPPLYGAGKQVKTGYFLLQVNGRDVTIKRNIYSYFEDMAGKQVALTVNSIPKLKGSKKINVKLGWGERTLRYQDWVETNRKKVEKVSGGLIGYIHLPDTYNGSATEFPKYFLPQMTKRGLIIDGRYNGGGLDPSIFLRRLNRKSHSWFTRRYSADQINPPNAVNAHMVLLTNKQAGSGGDELPFVFKSLKLGPVIGTRTWGGLVGVSMFIRLIDGGGITAPDYRIYSNDGKWIIENHGVDPDIIVDNDSFELSKGIDAQLMQGVKYIMNKLKKDPKKRVIHEKFVVEKR